MAIRKKERAQMGRPRGMVTPAARLGDVGGGMVRVFLRVPDALLPLLGTPRQRPVHLAIAVERLLLAHPIPALPRELAEGPGQQWTILRWQAERVEKWYGLDARDRAILLAIERYVAEI